MKTQRTWAIVGGILLAGILAIAFWLRWRYIHEISLYVDEFTTLWAATRVQELGVPRMPSGVLYTRGLLNSYIEAAVLSVFGFSYVNGRLVSLFFGLATILATFFIGRREWNARVGLLAALGLALLPEAIIWSGRARFYSQLQFFSLLAVWTAFVAIRSEEKQSERRWLAAFAVFFVLALYSQEETLLLYPPIILAMLLWRGWRYLLRPAVLICNIVCIGAIGLRYAIEILGQPGYFETIQSTRPYVGLIFDVIGAWRVYGPLIAGPQRLAWTIFALVAVIVALVALKPVHWQLTALSRFHQASLYFALLFTFVFVVLLALVGTTWRDARYLLLVQSFWLLVGSAGLVWTIDRLLAGQQWRWIATVAAGALLALLLWPGAQGTLAQQSRRLRPCAGLCGRASSGGRPSFSRRSRRPARWRWARATTTPSSGATRSLSLSTKPARRWTVGRAPSCSTRTSSLSTSSRMGSAPGSSPTASVWPPATSRTSRARCWSSLMWPSKSVACWPCWLTAGGNSRRYRDADAV